MKKVQAAFLMMFLLFAVMPARYGLLSAQPLYAEVWVNDDAPADWYGGNHVATLQEAVSLVAENGIIHVLPGEYYEDEPIEISKPVTIIGYEFPIIDGIIDIQNTQNILITGLNFTSTDIWYAIYLYNVTNVVIKGNQFGPLDDGYGVYSEYVQNLEIMDNVFLENYEAAVYAEYVWGLTIEGNEFVENGESDYGAIYMYETSMATIRGNAFSNNYYQDIYIDWAVSFLVIENNTFIANPDYNDYCIYAYSLTETTIRNNVISGYEFGIYIYYSANNVIDGNLITNSVSRGIYVGWSSNHLIKYNVIENTTGSYEPLGAYLYYSDYSKFEGNYIKNANHSGVRMEYIKNVTLFEIPSVDYQWLELDPADADVVITGDDHDIYYDTGDYYALPFTFPFFGRNITAIDVNTNGLIELLENGESCNECDDYNTHIDKDHFGHMDAIFALNDDLAAVGDGYVAIYNLTDRVVIDYYVITYPDWDYYGFISDWSGDFNITDYYLRFQVILYEDGRVRWNIKDFKPLMNYGDYWVGVYAQEENMEGVASDLLYGFNLGGGKSYEFSGSSGEPMKNDVVSYNIIENGTYRGIYVRESGSVLIKGNDISKFGDSILLMGSTNVDILGNYIHDSEYGISSQSSDMVEIHHNSITGNDVGVYNPLEPWINATLNWWGAPDGPSAIEGATYTGTTPTGSGDSVSDYVYFDPWLTTDPGLAAKIEFSSLRVTPTSVNPGDPVTVSAMVENVGTLLGEYTAELKIDGTVTEVSTGLVIPGDLIDVVFTPVFNEKGTYEVTIDGLPPIKVYIGVESRLATYNALYQMAIIWTNLFFAASDDFNELYLQAQESGVDNETLSLAMETYENATEVILHAWNEEDLEHLRRTLWNMRGVIPRVYEIRDAYLKVKEAISILESAMS
ncbi:hypothetical protein E3E26_01730 [Thermococcus sp. LS1]|uniref:right-handed parallel beta-helix repeat-containing protein n=1 Tax=Thermococcus sp. LS1 TaxID=1638259 RepID=UPI001438D65A|nr:right-handed parallel beta-helix repeat-containing protein [Thermococcus sp. LS1]NJD98520.1 hypothetical protein [Thermococcus sp. LS1]